MKLSFSLIPTFALILGCFSYFSIALKTRSFMFFVSHKISPMTMMLRFVATLVRKSLNTSAILPLSEITSISLTKVTFIGSLHSLERNFCVSLFKKREKKLL